MLVAVTGGTGFIGRRLIARHIARGDQVRYLTRNADAAVCEVAQPTVGHLNSPPEVLQDLLDGVDVLYHLAAELKDEKKMHETNVVGTQNLLAAAKGKPLRWVQLSSTGVYGIKLKADIDEDSPLNPVNAYEASKIESDKLVLEAMSTQGLQCVLLRPSNVYGADMPNQSLFQLIRMINRGLFFFMSKPGAIANYIHVDNVVEALLLCATQTLPANGRAYIVSDHRTLEAFVVIISDALGKAPPSLRLPEALIRGLAATFGRLPKFPLTLSRVDALTNRYCYYTKRIESELGYKNVVSMEDGIKELVHHAKI